MLDKKIIKKIVRNQKIFFKYFITFKSMNNDNMTLLQEINRFKYFVKNGRNKGVKFNYIGIHEFDQKKSSHFHMLIDVSVDYDYIRMLGNKKYLFIAGNVFSIYIVYVYDVDGVIDYIFKGDVKYHGCSSNIYINYLKLFK